MALMINPETIDTLEAQARRQIEQPRATPVAVNPGDLLKLIQLARSALAREAQSAKMLAHDRSMLVEETK